MKYCEFLWVLDVLSKYYPKHYTHELTLLAEDIFKWLNNELPEDSSARVYLQNCFGTPADAFKAIWKELQILAAPFLHLN